MERTGPGRQHARSRALQLSFTSLPKGRRPVAELLEGRTLFAASLPAGFQLQMVAPTQGQTTAMAIAPDGRLFYAEQNPARVRVVKNGTTLATPALTLPDPGLGNGGIHNMELDPAFATNGRIYIYYMRKIARAGAPDGGASQVLRYTMDPNNPDQVLASSRTVLLDGIYTDFGRHNGGAMHFGADGMLYIATGEGTDWSVNPPRTYAQDLSWLGGKVLRIKPDGTIPSDNPFVGQSGKRAEIWAYGLRNPFTSAIKPGTNTLLVNDVGSKKFEEINNIQKGKNYGWPLAEGPSSNASYTNPLYSYPHSDSLNGKDAAVTGGVFYAGTMFPASGIL